MPTTGEATGLPDASCELVTYGQCWHRLDERAAAVEAARIVAPGGQVAILYNQLWDVAEPWVLRLTRIMRSGDVHRTDRPPDLRVPGHRGHMDHPHRAEPSVKPGGSIVSRCCRSMSSPPRAHRGSEPTSRGGARTRRNSEWYLTEHLGYRPQDTVELLYQTQLWTARRA